MSECSSYLPLRVRSLGLHVLLGRRGSLLCRISDILACLLYSRGSLLCRISDILACLLHSRGSLLSQITETTASLLYPTGGLLRITLQFTTGLRDAVRYLLDILICILWQIATHLLEALT